MTTPRNGDYVLSVRQPFCHLLATGLKKIENRSRRTKIRGRVWLHASLTLNCRSWSEVIDAGSPPLRWDEGLWCEEEEVDLPPLPDLPLGCIIGSADLCACLEIDEVTDDIDPEGFARGPWCYLFRNAQLLETPIPMTGKVGWFKYQEACETAGK